MVYYDSWIVIEMYSLGNGILNQSWKWLLQVKSKGILLVHKIIIRLKLNMSLATMTNKSPYAPYPINSMSKYYFAALEYLTLQWGQNGRNGVSNHQPHHCLLSRLLDADQRKHQSSASLAFGRVIHRWPANSPHKGPVTRKMSIWWRHHDISLRDLAHI